MHHFEKKLGNIKKLIIFAVSKFNTMSDHLKKISAHDSYILYKVCSIYGVSIEDFLGKCRSRDLVNARKMASYYFRKVCNYSVTKIGRIISEIPKDHTTIIYHVKCFEHYLKYEDETKSLYSLLPIKAFTSLQYKPKN